jgi:hypothetical protein
LSRRINSEYGKLIIGRFVPEVPPSGPWPKGQIGYLGFSFLIGGQPHYAWAAVEFNVITMFGPPKLIVVLTGYAYETVPGMSISAGQTK